MLDEYGGCYVDVEQGHGFGIDGCGVEDLQIDGEQISLRVVSPMYQLRRPVTPDELYLKFGRVTAESYEISVNGAP